MNKIKKFYCGMCNDGVPRDRKGFRDHLRTKVKNQFFNTKGQGGNRVTKEKRKWVIEEEFK